MKLPDQDEEFDPVALALDALDSAENFRRGITGVDRPASAVVHALGAVTYGLLAVADEIRNLGETQCSPTRRKRSSGP